MSVSLLNVDDHLSLEFDTSDLQAVQSYIRERYPDVSTKASGTAAIVSFGGEDFTFQNEWDDPCLISRSGRGEELLRTIYAHFRGS